VASEPTALDDVLHVCAGLPLALAIVAARAHIASGSPLSALAAELRDERLRLSAFDDEDPTASLPAVLSWSVGSLVPNQATTFALLGIAPGPDIGLAAAASLTGLPDNAVGAQLDALVTASLIERTATGRYRMHDLVRLYARDQATGDDARSALRRVTDFYLHTAYGANQILTPYARLPHVDPAVEGCVPLPLTGNAAAMAWFDAEHACVLAAQQAAGGHGWHQVVWVLTRVLNTYHIRRARHGEELASCVAGLAAAQRLGDPTTVIGATRRLGDAYLRVGQRDTALEHLDRALKLAEDIGDQFQQAQTHRFLAMARSGHAEGRQPMEHAERALELYRAVDFAEGEAEALSLVGWLAALQGEYAYARENCLAALPLYRSQDNQDGLAATLDSLGYIGRATGQHADALDNYEQAVSIFRTVGNNYQLATTLDDIGSLHAAMDQPRLARTAWTEAEALYRANGREADSNRVRKQISDLD
jgi:tetratricopeptide (TPR) repeat protein